MRKRRTKLLSALLALSMALALLPVTALAADEAEIVRLDNSANDFKISGTNVKYTGRETVQDEGEERIVYLFSEGTVFMPGYPAYSFTEVKNVTTNTPVPVESVPTSYGTTQSQFTLPRDNNVYRIRMKRDSSWGKADQIAYVKCDTRVAVPGSEALMASQECTGTTEVSGHTVLLYPEGTVFSTVSGRKIYSLYKLSGINEESVADELIIFTLPGDGFAYRIFIPSSGGLWTKESESIYVKLDGGSKFQPAKTYAPGTFTDVPANEWYAGNVKSAYELDLVAGTSDTTFSPKDNISVASTVTLAARIHSIYATGQADFGQGNPWYQPYVDYAVKNGIIRAGQFSDYNANISRRDFAGIMCHALPAGEFRTINKIEENSIPDVAEGSAYCDEIYTFYKAGISVGNDEAGTYTPEAAIQRCAAAALVTRMVDPSLRIKDVELKTVVRPASVTMSKDTLTVYTEDSEFLTANLNPRNSTLPVYWTSSNPAVATVSKSSTLDMGLFGDSRKADTISVKGIAPGTAVITATCGGVSASTTVTVEKELTPVGHPESFGYKMNSVNGVSLNWGAKNTSGKTVNYYTVYGTYLDNIGNPAKDEITGKTTFALKKVGPIAPGEGFGFSRFGDPIGYVPWCKGIQIDQIKLEYSDGTIETINYGWKTTYEFEY